MKSSLTPVQHAILAYAINNTGARIEWFPPNVKGGARKKLLDGMFNRALITPSDSEWFVAAEGYDALGLPRPVVTTTIVTATALETETDGIAAEAADPKRTPRTRDHSKQATVIALLSRPEGATLAQITEATGWLVHSTRGFLAGAVKKRLGLTLTSEKPEGGVRIYRVID
ncbi:MAG: DUF3489 domain-containing protein [Sulfuritalea sp.]|nr:DUF3489 domain-containing protein [Sulfuritalea sp.]